MTELELSVMVRAPSNEADLRVLLEPFEAESRVQVRLRTLSWDAAWADLLKVALYQYGPDVSEIGDTWLSSFVAMDALQPLTGFKAAAIGDPAVFLPAPWQSCQVTQPVSGLSMPWAVPWWADPRILYYRRDVLRAAGVEEDGAFATPARLEETLACLQAAGVPVPWVVPTHQSRMMIHNAASWVWGAGGRFCTDDGRHATFAEPEARAGLQAYLGLVRFLAAAARGLDDTQSDALYRSGQAAATISGPWLLSGNLDPRTLANTGTTLPPGVPFVGGSQLVLWKHATHETAAVKLIHYLTSRDVQAAYGQKLGLLPTRYDVLTRQPFADNPRYQVSAEGLQRGRPFPSVPLWGLIEEKVNDALGQLWADLLADEQLAQPAALEQALAERLGKLANRLNLTLRSR